MPEEQKRILSLQNRIDILEKELLTSKEEFQKFLYIISHGLKEPLRMVKSYIGILEDDYKDIFDEDGKECVYFAIDGSERMALMLEDLLTLSRVETQVEEFNNINLEKMIIEIIKNFELEYDKDISIKHDELPVIKGDAKQIWSLFENLIGNSLKFNKSEIPKVTIAIDREFDSWLFSIKDNGIGIKTENLKDIFNVFRKLNNRTDYPGTGMGLPITKRILEMHNGKIWVKSEGEGATFYFTIPITCHDE